MISKKKNQTQKFQHCKMLDAQRKNRRELASA
jgi:hypothetical protein